MGLGHNGRQFAKKNKFPGGNFRVINRTKKSFFVILHLYDLFFNRDGKICLFVYSQVFALILEELMGLGLKDFGDIVKF